MRWWQQLPFSSSSSSSKSADILVSAASERSGLSSPRRSRARLRQLKETDADECRSQSYSPHARSPAAEAFAQPLPLPETQEAKLLPSRSRNVPLPSPGAAARSRRRSEERDKQSRSIITSDPTSPHSNGNTGLSSNCQMPSNKTALRFEDSPPKISSSESPVSWRESASHANVHTLPLPPVFDLSGASVSLSPHRAPTRSQWQKGKLIGRGTFGSVYVGSNRETGALCAMKEVEILPEDVKSQERMRQLQQEINVLSNLKHPNIVQYYGSEIVGDKFYIYLEYVHPGSINKFIHDHCAAITESVVRNFTRHILCGLAYLHSTKTIHRDIKGANLLVDAHGVVKLADFGMAKHLNGEAAYLSLKGSPYWLAPELLQPATPPKDAGADLGLAIDIWSLGCTIIEMINGKPPWSDYEGAAALFKVLKETPPIPETLSAEGKDFLQCCFRRNPVDRPTAVKLLDHAFVDCSRSSSLLTSPGHIKR